MLTIDHNPRPGDAASAPGRHLLDYWSVVVRRRNLVAAITLVAVLLAVWRGLGAKPVYQASVQLMVGRQLPQVLDFKDVTQIDAQNWGDEYHLTQLKILESRSLARRVVEKLRLTDEAEFSKVRREGQDPVERVVDAFLGRLEARRVEHSQFIAVTFRAQRPELAAAAANAVADQFVDDAMRLRAETAGQASTWLGVQIDEQRTKVSAAQDALQRLSEETGIVSFEERRSLLEQKLKLLGTHLTEGQALRLEREALYRQMQSVSDPRDLSLVMGTRTVQDMRMDLARLEQKESELIGSKHLDQHPDVIKVRAQIAEARQRLAGEAAHVVKAAENDYRTALAQERELARAVDAAKAEALDLNRRGLRYEALKRDLDAQQAVLNSLLTRSKQTDVAQEQRVAPIRIVDRAAVPSDPIGPHRRRNVALAFLLGLMAGVGAALLLDAFDPRVRTPRDVARLGVPLLAVVPDAGPGAPSLLFDPHSRSAFTDGSRVLRAALDHRLPAGGGRVVAFVSTQPREGKTLCAVNLALALAGREEPVVLVDADLRRPEAAQLLPGVHATPGLTDVLAGRTEALKALQSPEGTPLMLLAAGAPTPAPAEALRPAAVQALLEVLRARFQWTVIDTSPLGAGPDALPLAGAADGVVMVVCAEATPRREAAQALALLGQMGCPVLGVVLNRARVDRAPREYGVGLGVSAVEQPAKSRGSQLAAAD